MSYKYNIFYYIFYKISKLYDPFFFYFPRIGSIFIILMKQILLSTNVRDEHNIEEWIEFHCNVGFDHLLIYDDRSETPVETLHSCCTIIRVSGESKNELMTRAMEFAQENGFEFMLHLDGDEYIHLGWKYGVPRTIHSYLEDIVSEGIQAVYIPWLMFGSNGHVREPPKGSCLYPFTRCSAMTHPYTKTLARVCEMEGVEGPHRYHFRNATRIENTIYADGRSIVSYSPIQHRLRSPPSSNSIFIAHYRSQSWDHFRRRRAKPRDDTQTPWKFPFSLEDETPPLLFQKEANDVECFLMTRYFETIMRK